jgi:hypothetical protein
MVLALSSVRVIAASASFATTMGHE